MYIKWYATPYMSLSYFSAQGPFRIVKFWTKFRKSHFFLFLTPQNDFNGKNMLKMICHTIYVTFIFFSPRTFQNSERNFEKSYFFLFLTLQNDFKGKNMLKMICHTIYVTFIFFSPRTFQNCEILKKIRKKSFFPIFNPAKRF